MLKRDFSRVLFTVRTFNSRIAWNSNIRSCLSWSFDTRQRERGVRISRESIWDQELTEKRWEVESEYRVWPQTRSFNSSSFIYGLYFCFLQKYLIQEPMESFAFHHKIISNALKFCKSAANCTSFHWNHFKTPFTFWTISQRGRHE